MSCISGLIRKSFEWGLFLALIGGLGEATATMFKKAGNARAHGLVSLSSLNAQLMGKK